MADNINTVTHLSQPPQEPSPSPSLCPLFSTADLLHPGTINEFFNVIPFNVRLHYLIGWARELKDNPKYPNSMVVELIGGITTLDLRGWLTLSDSSGAIFETIFTALPFENLAEVDLSECELEKETGVAVLTALGSLPVFDKLVSLKLTNCGLRSITPLLSGTNTFPQLARLDFSNNYGINVSALSTTTKMVNLAELSFVGTSINTAVARDIAQSPTIPFRLKHVDLSDCNDIQHGVLARLLVSPAFRSVESLTLKRNRLDPKVITTLTAAGMPNLSSLDLYDTTIDSSASFVEFCASTAAESITKLSVGGTWVDDTCLVAIGAAPFAPNLQKLAISASKSITSLSVVLEPINNHCQKEEGSTVAKLDSFRVSSCHLPLSDFDLIATSPCLSQLTKLKLSYLTVKDTSDAGAVDAGAALHPRGTEGPHLVPVNNLNLGLLKLAQSRHTLRHLTHLTLCLVEPSIDKATFKTLLTSPNFSPNLKKLVLSLPGDAIDDEIASILGTEPITVDTTGAAACGTLGTTGTAFFSTNDNGSLSRLKFGHLENLSVPWSNIGPRGAHDIANLSALTHLVMNGNGIGDQGLTALIANHSDKSHDTCCIFSNNNTDDLIPIPKLSNLVNLDITACDITSVGMLALSKSALFEQLTDLAFGPSDSLSRGVLALMRSSRASYLRRLDSQGIGLLDDEDDDEDADGGDGQDNHDLDGDDAGAFSALTEQNRQRNCELHFWMG